MKQYVSGKCGLTHVQSFTTVTKPGHVGDINRYMYNKTLLRIISNLVSYRDITYRVTPNDLSIGEAIRQIIYWDTLIGSKVGSTKIQTVTLTSAIGVCKVVMAFPQSVTKNMKEKK